LIQQPAGRRLSSENAFLELLFDTLETLELPARGQFLKRFFLSVAHTDLAETQSLDVWDQIISRRRELSEGTHQEIAFQTALVDVLSSTNLLRLPVLMEYEDLRKLKVSAASDSLTGLYNRRFFDEFFEKELNRSSRYSHRLALVAFDMHRFKEVNDRHGHPQGDVLLQIAAATLRKYLRTSDYAFRVGGDEFALLLPQSHKEQATALSHRLRIAFAATIEPLRLGVPLALDYGVAVYPDDGDKKEILIRVADERMYRLKSESSSAATQEAPARTNPATREKDDPVDSGASLGEVSPFMDTKLTDAKLTEAERRRWERVSLANTSAYALIGEEVERTTRVIDLSYGGIAFETSRPERTDEAFHAVLHVPVLPPVRVSLRRIYKVAGSTGTSRIGCSFVT
jgi:diguanylate cyclase (GGDEF)-like protein